MYSITLLGEAEVLFDGVDMYGADATYALIAGEIDSSYFSWYDYTYGPFDFIGFVDTDFTGSKCVPARSPLPPPPVPQPTRRWHL